MMVGQHTYWVLQVLVTGMSSTKYVSNSLSEEYSLLSCKGFQHVGKNGDYGRSQDSSVGTVTGYGLDGPSLIPSMVRYLFSLQHPNQL